MKPKLILCLALVLTGSLLIFATLAHCAEEPVGLRLTGHVAFRGQTWPFEIVMEGYARYYREETYPKPKDEWLESKSANVPRVRDVAAIDDAGNSKDLAYVARRLWQGDRFRGVAADELRELVEYGHDTEEFLTPVSLKHFPIPCVIKWTDNGSAMPDKTMTYTIEKMEFLYDRNPQFWTDARKKCFDFVDHHPPPPPTWHEPLSLAQITATNALQTAKQNPDAAIADLRTALAQYPLNQPLGAWNQSVLLGALWQIRGLAEKDEIIDWFYRTLAHAPNPEKSQNGDLDHGPLCLLRAINSANRSEITELLATIIEDPRFDHTDTATIVEMLDMSYEGFPLPNGFDPEKINTVDRSVPRELLPLWRNALRRHYGVPEEKLK